MARLWVWSLSRDSLTLIIVIIPIKRHCCPIYAYAIIVLRIKLLHLFDTCTHLTSHHLPRYLFTHYCRLFPAVNYRPRMWPAPETMKTAAIIPTLHLFYCPIRHWLLIVLVRSVFFMDGFEAWEVEIYRVAIDWDACIRPDMNVVVSVTGMEWRRVIQWNFSVWWNLLTG